MRRVAALFALAAVSLATPLAAEEFTLGELPLRLDITSTTTGAWHGDNDDASARNDDYLELIERFNLGVGTGPWVLGLRFDSTTFGSPPVPQMRDRYILEKVWIGWSDPTFEITAGDSYVSYARGLTLSLRKVDELGVDTTLRGAKFVVRQVVFSASAVAGYVNIQNMDEATGISVGDSYDLIGGAQLQLALEPVILAVHGSAVAFRDGVGLAPSDEYRDRYYQIGTSVEAPRLGEHLGLYLEAMSQIRDTTSDDREVGLGLYGAATVYVGAFTVLLEGKAYGDLDPVKPRLPPEFASVAYNNPPTVERVQQIVENPQRDVYGGRLRADWSASAPILAYASYALFRDEIGYADPREVGSRRPGWIHDPYGGLEVRWDDDQSRLRLEGGVRLVELAHTQDIVRVDGHVELDAVQRLIDPWSLELHAVHLERTRRESPIFDKQYREGTLSLGLRLRPYLSLTGGYDYTTDPSQPKEHYFNATAQWEFTPGSSLRLHFGAARGGLKCVSGVCRTMPAFEGVKLVLTLRL